MDRTGDLSDHGLPVRDLDLRFLDVDDRHHMTRAAREIDDAHVVGRLADRPRLVRDRGLRGQHSLQPRRTGLTAVHDVDQQRGALLRQDLPVPDLLQQCRHGCRCGRIARVAVEDGVVGRHGFIRPLPFQDLAVVVRGDLVVLPHIRVPQPVGDQGPGRAVHTDPVDPHLGHARGHGARAPGLTHEHVGRDVVADQEHQLEQVVHRDLHARVVQQVADGAGGPVDISLLHFDHVPERYLALVHHGQDLHRDRDLVGARHREGLVAVKGEPASRFEVVRRDADRAFGVFGQPRDLGREPVQAGIVAECAGVLRARGGRKEKQEGQRSREGRRAGARAGRVGARVGGGRTGSGGAGGCRDGHGVLLRGGAEGGGDMVTLGRGGAGAPEDRTLATQEETDLHRKGERLAFRVTRT